MGHLLRKGTLLALASLILAIQLAGSASHAHALSDPGAAHTIDAECLLCAHKSPVRMAVSPQRHFAPASDAARLPVAAPTQAAVTPGPLLPTSGPRAPPQIA